MPVVFGKAPVRECRFVLLKAKGEMGLWDLGSRTGGYLIANVVPDSPPVSRSECTLGRGVGYNY